MIYKVQAKFDQSKAKEFYQLLTNGNLGKQKPDGPEIVASMHRATADSSGSINWKELCYCSPPLKHERATVYDHYFSDFVNKINIDENFVHVKTSEIIEREWEIDQRRVRPKSQAIGHSGFISFVRKI